MAETTSFQTSDLPPELQRALTAALEQLGRAPAVLFVKEIAGYTDWVLLISGRSDRHVAGITESIIEALASIGRKPIGTDGLADNLWDLLDYDDFMIHVFLHPVRTHYDLESMWSDAPRVAIEVPPELRDVSDLAGLPAPDNLPPYLGRGRFAGFADEFEQKQADWEIEESGENTKWEDDSDELDELDEWEDDEDDENDDGDDEEFAEDLEDEIAEEVLSSLDRDSTKPTQPKN